MIDRAKIKQEAKTYFKNHLVMAVVLCLIFSIFQSLLAGKSFSNAGINLEYKIMDPASFNETYNKDEYSLPSEWRVHNFSYGSNGISRNSVYFNGGLLNLSGEHLNRKNFDRLNSRTGFFTRKFLREIVIVVPAIILISFVTLSFLLKIFVFYPIVVGKNKVIIDGLRNEGRDLNLKDMFYYLRHNYLSVFPKIILKNIYLIGWFLLLIFPGIYKSYQYFFVEYILADYPEMSLGDAIDLSKKMTDDCKFEIFIMGLSFLGWILVSYITLGIGFFFLNPYMEISFANLYLDRLDAVINNRKKDEDADLIVGSKNIYRKKDEKPENEDFFNRSYGDYFEKERDGEDFESQETREENSPEDDIQEEDQNINVKESYDEERVRDKLRELLREIKIEKNNKKRK